MCCVCFYKGLRSLYVFFSNNRNLLATAVSVVPTGKHVLMTVSENLNFLKMEPWLILSMRIAVFGFLKEFRPEDPYITQYLTNPPMNFTNNEVSS